MPSVFATFEIPTSSYNKRTTVEIKNPSEVTLKQLFVEYLPSGGTTSEFRLHPKWLISSNQKQIQYRTVMEDKKLSEISKSMGSNKIVFHDFTFKSNN